jgi:ABC-type transporter Mla subunit MlaD
MATPHQKVQVGIFLTVCTTLLVGILAVLSGVQREKSIPYVIEFDESVSGLQPGSDVRYRGVPVGRVTEITVTPTNRIRARVEIRPSIIRVRQGMTAQLNTTGVTGQLYVNLTGGEPEGVPLVADETIPSQPSLLANLSTEIPTLLASINSVLVRIDKALGEEGQVATIVQDVGRLITVLNTTVAAVGTQTMALLARANTLLEKEISPLVAEVNTTAQTSRRVLEHLEPPLQAALVSSTKALQQLEKHLAALDLQGTNATAQLTLQRLTQLAEQLGHTSTELNLTLQHIRGDTTNTEFHIRQAVRSLRETLLSAKQLFDYLEQDPAALVLGKRPSANTRDGQRR